MWGAEGITRKGIWRGFGGGWNWQSFISISWLEWWLHKCLPCNNSLSYIFVLCVFLYLFCFFNKKFVLFLFFLRLMQNMKSIRRDLCCMLLSFQNTCQCLPKILERPHFPIKFSKTCSWHNKQTYISVYNLI